MLAGLHEQIVELTTPEGHTYRVQKLNPEERTQKILRYRQKRHERNFTKRIKYQCRKTLADSRPRVRGRFARNDDAGAVMPHESKKAQKARQMKEQQAAAQAGGVLLQTIVLLMGVVLVVLIGSVASRIALRFEDALNGG